MQTVPAQFDIPALQASWVAFETVADLRPIRSDADYNHMLALMNSILAAVGEDEDHPLSGFLELVSDLVSLYEREHFPVPPADPVEALRFLMKARGLKQEDLSNVVAQGNLSAILAGKRNISAKLAAKLGLVFDVNPALFIPSVTASQ
ncbi:MAG: transcriptional regulator [Candidatus Accumulibacter sp.]|jgi:HTH-type transcriptional regulator/antitoxin HigA|nr:transcriptional regulator [Accumulibacter sp.]